MPSIDDDQWDTAKNMAMIAKVAAVSTQLLINSYGYHDVARLITVKDQDEDDEEEQERDEDETEEETDEEDECCESKYIEARGDDPLAEVLVNSFVYGCT